MPTSNAIHQALLGVVDTVSKKGDVFTVRKGFFYTHGNSPETVWARVQAKFPGAVLVDKGSQWKPFRGGHTIAQGSHFWVKFTLTH